MIVIPLANKQKTDAGASSYELAQSLIASPMSRDVCLFIATIFLPEFCLANTETFTLDEFLDICDDLVFQNLSSRQSDWTFVY